MISVTKANIGDILGIIIKDQNVFDTVSKEHTAILADWVSFKNNPNCSCRGKVTKYFSDLLDQDPMVLNKYVTNEVLINNEMAKLTEMRMANNYSGRVFKIEKTEDAWKNFTVGLMGKMFRSFALLEKEDHILVYFL